MDSTLPRGHPYTSKGFFATCSASLYASSRPVSLAWWSNCRVRAREKRGKGSDKAVAGRCRRTHPVQRALFQLKRRRQHPRDALAVVEAVQTGRMLLVSGNGGAILPRQEAAFGTRTHKACTAACISSDHAGTPASRTMSVTCAPQP